MAVYFFCGASLSAAEMYGSQALFSKPDGQSEKTGVAAQGTVSIVKRRGYWVKVKSGDVIGWTKLSNVRMEEMITWMDPIDTLHDTGRLAPGN
ncbi:MAG: SH3 domain-containing protein [Mariprofundaceae bacterium]